MSTTYLHGTTPAEQQRLSRRQELRNAAELARSSRVRRAQRSDALRALLAWRRGAHATVWTSIPLVEGRRR
ncbi:MAG: hypothetical protein IPN34_13560 [Planctomycetes bacterium]|nr:hypothetical protein [Planctomycetota bacterium]